MKYLPFAHWLYLCEDHDSYHQAERAALSAKAPGEQMCMPQRMSYQPTSMLCEARWATGEEPCQKRATCAYEVIFSRATDEQHDLSDLDN